MWAFPKTWNRSATAHLVGSLRPRRARRPVVLPRSAPISGITTCIVVLMLVTSESRSPSGRLVALLYYGLDSISISEV